MLFAITGECFSTIYQSVAKDWLVVLSDGDADWLTNTNAVMSQIDLLCNSLSSVSILCSLLIYWYIHNILVYT